MGVMAVTGPPVQETVGAISGGSGARPPNSKDSGGTYETFKTSVREKPDMRTRARISFVVAAAVTLLLAFASGAIADPPDDLTSPPNHRHFISTSNGPVPVGPQICEDPGLQQAFDQFHYNVHHSVVPGIGEIPTNGPQDGAPGLHNGQGGEVFGVPGC